jgi:hypothetical protein
VRLLFCKRQARVAYFEQIEIVESPRRGKLRDGYDLVDNTEDARPRVGDIISYFLREGWNVSFLAY